MLKTNWNCYGTHDVSRRIVRISESTLSPSKDTRVRTQPPRPKTHTNFARRASRERERNEHIGRRNPRDLERAVSARCQTRDSAYRTRKFACRIGSFTCPTGNFAWRSRVSLTRGRKNARRDARALSNSARALSH